MGNWPTPTSGDLAKVMSLSILAAADQNTDAASVAQALLSPDTRQTFDPGLDDRMTDKINLVVMQFRGAIQVAGKYPLSCTAGTIPPELYNDVLNMAAWEVAMSTPNLKMFVMSDKGMSAPFATFHKNARNTLELITKGRGISLPSDPTGRDYLNPINVPWNGYGTSPFPTYVPANPINLPIESIRVGGMSERTDLSTEGAYFEEPAPPWWPAGQLGQP